MNKKKIALICLCVFIGLVIISSATSKPNLQKRIDTITDLGFPVNLNTPSFEDLQTDRIFEQVNDWDDFIDQVETIKDELGFVTVNICENDKILWVHSTNDICYYFLVET